MMPRLIDADILLTAFPKGENEIFRTSAVRGTIDACPTVDAVPVVHGKWNCSDDFFESAICSICGNDTGEPYEYVLEKYAFCPFCGAKMDGKDGEGNG